MLKTGFLYLSRSSSNAFSSPLRQRSICLASSRLNPYTLPYVGLRIMFPLDHRKIYGISLPYPLSAKKIPSSLPQGKLNLPPPRVQRVMTREAVKREGTHANLTILSHRRIYPCHHDHRTCRAEWFRRTGSCDESFCIMIITWLIICLPCTERGENNIHHRLGELNFILTRFLQILNIGPTITYCTTG